MKKETYEEYIARGGKVTKLDPVERELQVEVVRTSNAGEPATIMSLEEADLFYGEPRKGTKPKKPKTTAKIDINALPEALREKFIQKMKEEHNGEEDSSEEN